LKQRFGSITNIFVPLVGLILATGGSPAQAGSLPPASEVPTKGFQTKSGLQYFDIKTTNDRYPLWGQFVTFQYICYYRPKSTNKLEVVDSSYFNKGEVMRIVVLLARLKQVQLTRLYANTTGSQPFLQKHGNGRVIRGIDEALHTMGIGAKRRIIVPKSIGTSFHSFFLEYDSQLVYLIRL
jgi:hypothetical protein